MNFMATQPPSSPPAPAVQRPVRARRWEDGDRRRAPAQLRPTVYVAEKLLVRGEQADQGIEPKVATLLAERFGWTLSPVRKPEPRREYRLDVKLEPGIPADFSFESTVVSHGWYVMPPFRWDAGSGVLHRVETFDGAGALDLAIRFDAGKLVSGASWEQTLDRLIGLVVDADLRRGQQTA